MNKRELKKWLEDEENKKLKDLRDEYIKASKQLLTSQLEARGIDAVIKKAMELGKETEDWLKTYGEEFGLSVNMYGQDYLSYWSRMQDTLPDFKRKIASDIRVSSSSLAQHNKEFMELSKKYEETRDGICNAYTTLIANLTAFKTSKDAVEYLKGLGMEVPKGEEECTALIAPVDTRFLFIR